MSDLSGSRSAADLLNDALERAGVRCIFANLGTDYPPIIESWARHKALGEAMPQVIIAPHEYAAVSAAQGYAQVSGTPQAVFVHVDVGTQNMGGALHNAFRCRVPMFILAGLSPYTMEGELPGSRDAYIQFIQNTGDQAGIVRGYTKLCTELRSGVNVQQNVYRALQIACSEPKGPVYLTAARETLEEAGRRIDRGPDAWQPIAPVGLDEESAGVLLSALTGAQRPLVITSYLGRDRAAVGALTAFCRRLAVPVLEANPVAMNYPADDELYLGDDPSLVERADVILSVDCDLPWPVGVSPAAGCRIFSLDVDPIKEHIPLWNIGAERAMKCSARAALEQLAAKIDAAGFDPALSARIEARRARIAAKHAAYSAAVARAELPPADRLTPEYVTACLRSFLREDDIVLNEVISYGQTVHRHLRRSAPGTLFASGGSSLGWFGGAAVGAKLAAPDRRVVALASDGTFIFSCPTAVYWMARRYGAPFLTVIYNNEGWGAPKSITRRQHPGGYADRTGEFWSDFAPAAELEKVAEAAGGALALRVTRPDELAGALRRGFDAVDGGVSAVISVMLPGV